MDDKTQTSQNTEYAGPPKSHDFRDAKNVQQEPQQQQKEAPVKMTTTSSSATAEPNLLSMISAPDRVVPVVKKKKRQMLNQLAHAKTPAQIYSTLLINRKEKS